MFGQLYRSGFEMRRRKNRLELGCYARGNPGDWRRNSFAVQGSIGLLKPNDPMSGPPGQAALLARQGVHAPIIQMPALPAAPIILPVRPVFAVGLPVPPLPPAGLPPPPAAAWLSPHPTRLIRAVFNRAFRHWGRDLLNQFWRAWREALRPLCRDFRRGQCRFGRSILCMPLVRLHCVDVWLFFPGTAAIATDG